MATFPTLSSGSMTVSSSIDSEAFAMYPASTQLSYVTRVIRFLGDQEQRWTVRNALFAATLEYRSLNGHDVSLLTEFFRSMKGAYVDPLLLNVFDITLQGINYQYCCFDQDDMTATSVSGETFNLVLKIKQIRPN